MHQGVIQRRMARLTVLAGASLFLAFAIGSVAAADDTKPKIDLQADLTTIDFSDFEYTRPAAAGTWRAPIQSSEGFWEQRFLPKVNYRLGHLSAIHLDRHANGALAESLLYDQALRSAQNGVEKAARDALEEILIDESVIGRMLGRTPAGAADEPGPRKSLRWDLGVRHGTPRVGLRYRLDGRQLRFHVDFEGSVGLDLRGRAARSYIAARYDARRDVYSVGCLLPF